jgi:SAM-dependent methyltransferase
LALSKWILHFVQDDNRTDRACLLPWVFTSVTDYHYQPPNTKGVRDSPIPISNVDTLVANFSRVAANYRHHARVQTALAGWLAEWLPAERTGRALEMGAGPGIFTRHLLPWTGDLVATDISPAMCEVGRAELPHVEWRVGPAEAPPPGPWDWIFCSGMLQWADEPEKVFSAVRNGLRPGGRLLAGLFVEGSLAEWRALAGQASPLVWRQAEEWCACIRRSGLSVTRDEVQSRVFEYSSALVFLRSVHGVGGAPRRAFSPGCLRRLLRDYEARFGATGRVPATWMFCRIEAVRRN